VQRIGVVRTRNVRPIPDVHGATLGPGTAFREASFGDRPTFAGAALGEGFGFDSAAFGDEASFERARLGANGSFRASSFGGGAVFRYASFEGDVSFARSRFGDDAQIGPFAVSGQISFEQALVGLGARMDIAADRVVCTGLNAPHGLTLRARWSEVELDSAQFGAASIVSGSDTPFDGVDESKVQAATGTGASARPRILTLANSDVQYLLLADIDLSNCRFLGARNLDKLLLERPLSLPRTPPGVQHGRALPPVWRWTRRETLPEEHEWRQGTRKKAGWRTPAAREAPAMKRDDANTYRRAVQTLRGARDRLEGRHRIKITDEALGAAALLTLRHVTDEDVSGRSLEVVTAATVRASGTAPVPSAQRDGPGEELRRTIAAVREEKEAAIEAQEFERAAALRDKERKLSIKLREVEPSFPRWAGPSEAQPEIGREEVVQLLSSWVGLPVETLLAELDDEDNRAQSTVPSAPPTPRERRVDAAQVASLYRSLRKGREDNKDEPGAADFYYGEMEMRRKAAQPGSVERALLTIYWAASGYGLRASRAFALLLAALVLHTFLVVHWGFSHHLSLGRSITFTVSNALLRGSGHVQLTVWGEVLQISLRLLGPLLLALTLLSVRGRLKR
jgi:hypothetical protein